MVLFPALVAPLWYMLIISLYKSPARGWWSILEPWIGGVFIGIITLTMTLSLLPGSVFSIEAKRLFAWAWIRQTGWPLSFGIVIVCAIYSCRPVQHSQLRELAGWFTGISTVYMIWKALVPDTGFEDYHIFFTPVLWIMQTGIIIYLINIGLRLTGWIRYAYFAGTLAIPSILTLLPMFYVKGNHTGVWLVTLVLVLAIHLIILLDSRGRVGRKDGFF